MSELTAIVITAWATVATAIAAFLAVAFGYKQASKALEEGRRASDETIRQGKIATSYQLINQIDQQWNSAAMRAKRQEMAKRLLPLHPLPEDDGIDDILDLFETLALCISDEVIPLKLAAHFFGYWIIGYWFAASARVEYFRALDPTIWEDLNALMPKLLSYQASRRRQSIEEVRPTSEHLRRFLQEEASG